MKARKSVLSMNATSLVSIIVCVVLAIINARRGKPVESKIDKDSDWIVDCIDEMIADIKQICCRQDEQERFLKELESKIEK